MKIENSINPFQPGDSNDMNLDVSGLHKAKVHDTQSAEESKIDSFCTEIILHQPLAAGPSTTLKSYAPEHPEASEIANHMKLSPALEGLTTEQKQKVVDECIKAYTESVEVFESVIGEVSQKHPDGKQFARELVQRFNHVAEAYQEILIEDTPDNYLLSPLMKELKVKLGASSEFFQDGTGTGSVGSNPQAIQNALKNGELREHLTLIYPAVRSILTKVFVDPDLVDRVNAKLIEKQAGFQLNTEEINKKREQAKVGSSISETYFPRAKPLVDFRKEGRIDNTNPREPAPQVKDVKKDITFREYLGTVGYGITKTQFEAMKNGEVAEEKWGEHRVQWVRGKDLFKVAENSDFFKQSIALGKLPIVTGPSGTADFFLQGANYLNMNTEEQKNKAIMAFTGWMVRSGDHSYHEIKVAGTWHGLEYNPGPDVFENAYSPDPNFQKEINASMREQGKELPGEYLKDAYQLRMAQKLGFTSKPQQ